mmetsp:Transcript_160896/g.283508  ORF Transcript_160896/g.283508 Transcript_160896/m.283508 type:complete len:143 (+) Transcript_160896:60-488(+)
MYPCCCKRETKHAAQVVEADTGSRDLDELISVIEPFLVEVMQQDVRERDQDEKANPQACEHPTDTKGCILFDNNGEEVQIKFFRHPLGITFDKCLPIVVKKVVGNAEELGVEPGWRIKAIAGSPVGEKDFETLVDELLDLQT